MPFARDSLQSIQARVKADLVSALGTAAGFFRRSVERATQRALAGQSHELRGHLAWIARQVDPRTADADMVEKVHGEPFGVYRKDAEFAQFTADAPGSNGTNVPAGTVWLRVSDGARFTTDEDAEVSGGVAAIALTAEEAGDAGNCEDGDGLELEAPIVGMDGTCEITSTTNDGTDLESDEDYLVRVLARHQTPPRGGADGDYEEWALEVAGITRAWEFKRKPYVGWVTVYAVNDDDAPITLSGGKLTELAEYIGTRKPSTADVATLTPTLVTLDFEVTLSPDTPEIRAAVAEQLAALIRSVGTPAGMTLPMSKINEAISAAPGESDHVLVSPAADVVVPFGSLLVMGDVT